LKAPARSRLNIETTHLRRARYIVYTHMVIRLIVERVDLFFLAPIWVYKRRSCSSIIWLSRLAITFSTTLANVFSSAIS
jgi:hypothetical protein